MPRAEPHKKPGRPALPPERRKKSTPWSFRFGDELLDQVSHRAVVEGVSVPDVVREALRRYLLAPARKKHFV
jgi:hypothetical protein